MRTKNSLINVTVSLLSQFIILIIAFPARMVFIKILGIEYLGINGLFTNIISILSIAELGIGSAITFSLYKPISDDNEIEISGIMNLYAKIYKSIGTIVFLLGLMLIPFLNIIVGDNNNVSNLIVIYLLFLSNSSISYFLSYKRSIIIAYEKSYIINIIHSLVLIGLNIIQVVILFLTKSYIFYLVIQLVLNFSENIIISMIADKKFSFLTTKENKRNIIVPEVKKNIVTNIRALVIHKLGSITVLGTDNIIISVFVGLKWVGLYSNYLLIVNAINSFINQIFSSITASVGNLNVTTNVRKRYEIFSHILFINFWIVSFCTITLYVLLNPFIGIWLGNEFAMNNGIVLCIVINFYITGMRQTVLTFKSASGLFWQDRYKPLIESIINIVLSIILAKKIGISGVLLGTIISALSTSVWIEPFVVFKYGFNLSLKLYFKKYFNYTFIMIISLIVTTILTNLINSTAFITFILKMILCVLIPNAIFFIFFKNTQEFKYFLKIVCDWLESLKIKKE